MKTLALLHTQADGTLPKAALEAITAAQSACGSKPDIAVFGPGAAAAAASVAGLAERAFSLENEAVSAPRYGSDVAAELALIEASGAELVVAPGTSRMARSLPGAGARMGAAVDTHVVGLESCGEGAPKAKRWFYRQRILGSFSRSKGPWVVLVDGGVFAPAEAVAGVATAVEGVFGPARTEVVGVVRPAADEQTIKPEAKLLFVAGAGWTKKQKDGLAHVEEAAGLIRGFLSKSGASLGSSKSIVDLQSEGTQALGFMTHMNQVGQTGASPRHPKGLSTCCHGEEPHVVGWRFIGERRAVNTDPNCGWAQGKADVLYVADAFEVLARLNELI